MTASAHGGWADRLELAVFNAVTVRNAPPPSDADDAHEAAFQRGLGSAHQFLGRYPDGLRVPDQSVLDVGCGSGAMCVELAQRGAARVVGVDIQPLGWARENLDRRYPHLSGRVELISTDGSLRELSDERFDLVISKDSFEHYRDPEAFVAVMAGLLAPGGRLAIGFGPLWMGPTGGHIGYMTWLPWAHLIFHESVIMDVRRRFRPDEPAQRFEDVRGGLNRMTLSRFRRIMQQSGLHERYFATNVSDNPVVRAMNLVSRIGPLREYFTANVYGVWDCAGE